jgi:hypothetical protein
MSGPKPFAPAGRRMGTLVFNAPVKRSVLNDSCAAAAPPPVEVPEPAVAEAKALCPTSKELITQASTITLEHRFQHLIFGLFPRSTVRHPDARARDPLSARLLVLSLSQAPNS